MGVYCRQVAEGEPDQTLTIEPHSPDQTDAELLRLKAESGADKGWTVEWTSPTSFTATKTRWGGVECVRTFWAD